MAEKVRRCTIVSGAPDDDIDFIKNNISPDSFIIAADSGYIKLSAIGVEPDLIIGDFDSSDKPSCNCEVVTLPVEKEHTDTFAAVILATERGYNDITVLGAIGNRVDHTYSNILCLDYCRKNDTACRIVNRKNRISLIDGKAVIYPEYKWFSLFAFLEECKGVSIEGAHYTAGFYGLEKLDLKPYDQFAQSNYVDGDFATITCEIGTLLLIESND